MSTDVRFLFLGANVFFRSAGDDVTATVRVARRVPLGAGRYSTALAGNGCGYPTDARRTARSVPGVRLIPPPQPLPRRQLNGNVRYDGVNRGEHVRKRPAGAVCPSDGRKVECIKVIIFYLQYTFSGRKVGRHGRSRLAAVGS